MGNNFYRILLLGDKDTRIIRFAYHFLNYPRPKAEYPYSVVTEIFDKTVTTLFFPFTDELKAYIQSHISNFDGIIIGIDLNNPECIKSLSYWISLYKEKSRNNLKIPIFILGISDLIYTNSINQTRANLLESIKYYKIENYSLFKYFEVSFFEEKNLKKAFASMLSYLIDRPSVCYNCFKAKDEFIISKKFFICDECKEENLDIDKAMAFHKLKR